MVGRAIRLPETGDHLAPERCPFVPRQFRAGDATSPASQGSETLCNRRQAEGGASFCCMHSRVQRVAEARLGAAAALLASTVVSTAGGSALAKPLSTRVLN